MKRAIAKKTIVFLLCCTFCIGAIGQSAINRNEQVRSLNYIVDYMDETSRFQQRIFFDLIWFSNAYFSNKVDSKKMVWQISIEANARSKSSDYNQYKELKTDADGFIDDYQSYLLPIYRTKKKLEDHLIKFPVKNHNVNNAFTAFHDCFGTMEKQYKQLVDYVHGKAFNSDNGLNKAKRMLDSLQSSFLSYHHYSKDLYTNISNYYNQDLSPLSTQKTICLAQQELVKSVNLLEKWEGQLYEGDDSYRAKNDGELRQLNKQGLSKTDSYLSNIYGFNVLDNGAFPHARYLHFFKEMPTSIFWFVTDTSRQYKNIPKTDETYDKFVNRYNTTIDSYNQFIECADGKTSAKNLDYSMPMAAKLGVDTAQNVLLKKPRIPYKFSLLNEENPTTNEYHIKTTDTLQYRRRKMILGAVPHHTIYLLDVSNSMLEYNKLDTLKQSMKYLIDLQRPVDYISVITFADSSVRRIQLESCDEKIKIHNIIDHLKTSGATNAEAAVNDGYKLVDSSLLYKGKTKVVIITDGQFTLEKKTKNKIEQYQSKGIELTILLLGKFHDRDTIEYFEELCKKGNGHFYDMRNYNLQEILVQEASN